MAIAFASPACTRTLVFLDEVEGKCAEIEALGRQSVSAWANNPAGYPWLAEGIVGTGKPVAAALQALASRWALLPADARRPAELADRMRVELLDGDFVAAEGDASELEKAVGPDPGLSSHGVPARALVALYTEQGRLADAGRVAEEFLSKRDVWLGEQTSRTSRCFATRRPTCSRRGFEPAGHEPASRPTASAGWLTSGGSCRRSSVATFGPTRTRPSPRRRMRRSRHSQPCLANPYRRSSPSPSSRRASARR